MAERTGADSLVNMVVRATAKNAGTIVDYGDVRFKLIEPVLRRVEEPEHLIRIQEQNPGFAEHTGEIWQRLIKRDIPNWESRILYPKNQASWYKVYRKLEREDRKRKEESEANLLAAMKDWEKKKETNKTTYIEQTVRAGPKIPVLHYPGQPGWSPTGEPSNRRWGTSVGPGAGNRALKTAKTGSQMLKAIRQQSTAASRQRSIAQPTGNNVALDRQRLTASRQIVKAPKSMVMNKLPVTPRPTKEANSLAKPTDSRAFPGLNKVPPTAREQARERTLNAALASERAAKEERLRKLTTKGAQPTLKQDVPPRQTVPDRSATQPTTNRVSPDPKPAALIKKRPASSVLLPAKRRRLP